VNSLFIELYLDEDVSVLVAELLRARGFVAITAREAGRHLQKSDAEQLAYAVSHSKALLTHNRADFEALARQYYEGGRTHHGIILAVRRSPHEIVRRLLAILNQVTADEMQNQVVYI
jgi:predicted nuclease of predicted toxin-antitoxin system